VVIPTEDSGSLTYTVFGASTPERVYQAAKRTQLVSGTVPTDGMQLYRPLRDPVLMLQLSGAGTERVGVEVVEVETKPGSILSRRRRAAVTRVEATGATPVEDEETPPDEGEGSGVLSGSFSISSDNFSTHGDDFPLAFRNRSAVTPGSPTTAIATSGDNDQPDGDIIVVLPH
jgi:hypothetical protein